MFRGIAFCGMDGKGSLQCWEFSVARQGFSPNLAICGVCQDNLFQQVLVHVVDVVESEATTVASRIRRGKKGHKMRNTIDSGKEITESGPLDHRAEVAEIVDRAKVVVY